MAEGFFVRFPDDCCRDSLFLYFFISLQKKKMKKRKLLGKKKYTLQYEALLMGQQFPL